MSCCNGFVGVREEVDEGWAWSRAEKSMIPMRYESSILKVIHCAYEYQDWRMCM